MAKTIQMRTSQQKKEARLVAGMYDKNKKIQSELYAYCSRYFWANYRGVFSLMRKLLRRYSKTHSLRCGKT